jgi:methionyl-tRNA synthetase
MAWCRLRGSPPRLTWLYRSLAIHESLASIWTIVEELNGYITIQEPWVLAKSEETRERLGTVLYTAMEGLRALAVLMSPVIPDSTTKLWDALGAASGLGALTDQSIPEAGTWGQLPTGSVVGKLEALFPRIETDTTAG